MASDLLLTTKERARLAKVQEALTKGENPYSKLELLNIGSSTEKHKKPQKTLTRQERKNLVKHWKSGVRTQPARTNGIQFAAGNFPNSPISQLLTNLDTVEARIHKIEHPVCSFCGVDVARISCTQAKIPKSMIKRVITELESGDIRIDKEVIHFSHELLACEKCCHKVNGIDKITKKVVKVNTVFPTDE